ncbi:hypothetical protein ACIG56_00295 [Nocardia fusca]|uniref:hypothetical protein n=1 Tax=Nocardia fusca TaxID=941183 RepID=UPI0037C939C5
MQLRATGRQLARRRDKLTTAIDTAPTGPDPGTLTSIADHISELITTGTDHTHKAVIETLIAEVKITAPDTVVPVFRFPKHPLTPTPTPAPHMQQPVPHTPWPPQTKLGP